MLRTRLCELLNIEVPVIGAPMGPEIASLELAAAVSNAGGLGMISFGGYPPPALKERIRKLRGLTSKPFGVNVILEGLHLPLPSAAYVEACIEERVPVLSFFWGDPAPYVARAHSTGIKVCDQVGSVAGAKRAQRAGGRFHHRAGSRSRRSHCGHGWDDGPCAARCRQRCTGSRRGGRRHRRWKRAGGGVGSRR